MRACGNERSPYYNPIIMYSFIFLILESKPAQLDFSKICAVLLLM